MKRHFTCIVGGNRCRANRTVQHLHIGTYSQLEHVLTGLKPKGMYTASNCQQSSLGDNINYLKVSIEHKWESAAKIVCGFLQMSETSGCALD